MKCTGHWINQISMTAENKTIQYILITVECLTSQTEGQGLWDKCQSTQFISSSISLLSSVLSQAQQGGCIFDFVT